MQKNKKTYEKTIWRDGETIISADLLNKVEDKLVDLDSQVASVEHENQRQNFYINALYNENIDGRLTAEGEGNDLKLESSKQGLVEVEKVVGNTLVNRVSEPMRELTLNGDIDIEGISVTTTEGVENGLVDVMCEGNTLVNLLPNRELKINCSIDWDCYWAIGRPNETLDINFGNAIQDVKPNTEYTLIYNVVKRPTNSYYCINNPNINTVFNSTVRVFEDSPLGINKIKLTTVSDLTGRNIVLRQQNSTSRGEIHIKDYILLEGDWTNKEIPSYFTGMKSVGECADGNHKIEILSSNKNILSPIKNKKHPFYIKKGTKLILTPKNNETSLGGNVKLYDISGNVQWMGINAGETSSLYRVTNNDIFYIENSLTGDVEHQLEISTTPTSHVPHASNKKEILLNEPLRRLPNGVKDKLIKIDGKWFIERNCKEIMLETSNIKWSVQETTDISTLFITNSILTDSPNSTSTKNGSIIINTPCIAMTHTIGLTTGNHATYYNISSTIAKTVEELNVWLQQNPTTVVYQLKTPIYEPLEIAPELVCYDEVTHISNNSIVPCNMKVKNTGFSCRALTSDGTYTVVHNGGEEVTSKVDAVDNIVRLRGKGKKVSDVMVLDGEVSKTYGSFEGIQSTFEDKLVTQEMVDKGLEKVENLGKYKVGVKVTGKNKFDGKFELGTINGDTGKLVPHGNCLRSDFIFIESNSVTAMCETNGIGLFVYDANKRFLACRGSDDIKPQTLTKSGVKYARIVLFNTKNTAHKAQLEYGTQATQYEPYREYKTSVYLNSPLLKGDEIVIKEDGLYHYHKMELIDYTKVNITYLKDYNVCGVGLTDDKYALYYDKIGTLPLSVNTIRGINQIGLDNPNQYNCNSSSEFLKYLTDNNFRCIVTLKEPYYEKISDDKFISEMPNNATLSIDSIIPCQNIKVSYTGNLPSVYKLENDISIIEDHNIDIIATTFDMDYRLLEFGWMLEESGIAGVDLLSTLNTAELKNRTLSRYEQAKIIIIGKAYDKETLTSQLTKYLEKEIITKTEYDELIALMEVNE